MGRNGLNATGGSEKQHTKKKRKTVPYISKENETYYNIR